MKKRSLEENRKTIIDYVKKNPQATYKDIRRNIKLHPERYFKSLKEAFEEAKIKPPRTFDIKTVEERRKIIINFINKNPKAGIQIITKETKVNIHKVFRNIEEAFKVSGVAYSRRENTLLKNRTKDERKRQIIKIVKENPLISLEEIRSKTKTNPYRIFKNIGEIYKESGVPPIKKKEKWKLKKREQIIKFIKDNPLATQREINKNCNTHVQTIFDKGIFEAYEKAGIKFPFERLKLYGIGIKAVRDRAKIFEEEMAIKLSGFGKVNRLVKTKRGFADIIFERKGNKAVIEIKDYQNKDISISQIKQLNKYLEDCDCNLGILICRNKPKKDKFLIDKNKIFILDEFELIKIPTLLRDV